MLATLKKGQSFGDHAILNAEPRSDCVAPTSNCTFLTVERGPFVEIFGAFFREKLAQAQQFFRAKVRRASCIRCCWRWLAVRVLGSHGWLVQ